MSSTTKDDSVVPTAHHHESLETSSSSSSTFWHTSTCLLFMILLRTLVGFHPHSGQDNYHGGGYQQQQQDNDGSSGSGSDSGVAAAAYGGDYEAQRHWMELTVHVPIGDWYFYDLDYWGLDYPPLTAYVSWICGKASQWLVGYDSVALMESRGGYEDPTHKAFMRGTVLILDILVYFTAVLAISKRLLLVSSIRSGRRSSTQPQEEQRVRRGRCIVVLLSLAQPSLILVDHGHFQYNTVSLGLALWAFHYMTMTSSSSLLSSSSLYTEFRHCIIGAVFFCLALNFKQMILYYAPAVFFFLLGRCFAPHHHHDEGSPTSSRSITFQWKRFVALGVTVVGTFGALWWPFAVYPPSSHDHHHPNNSVSVTQRLLQVLHRLFPFQRGLFEGKVSNLWCALSVNPIKIRERVPTDLQPFVALFMTVLLMAPACYLLFQVGRRASQKLQQQQQQQQKDWILLVSLLWGTASTSLAFFLASFQVHEKSILMTVTSLSLLFVVRPPSPPVSQNNSNGSTTTTTTTLTTAAASPPRYFAAWFSVASAWTLWPLLCIDRLQMAYLMINLIFVCMMIILMNHCHDQQQPLLLALLSGDESSAEAAAEQTTSTSSKDDDKDSDNNNNNNNVALQSDALLHLCWNKIIMPLSILGMIGLHLLELFVVPPLHLPDLFPVLWSVGGCAIFAVSWFVTCWQLYRITETSSSSSSLVVLHEKQA